VKIHPAVPENLLLTGQALKNKEKTLAKYIALPASGLNDMHIK